MKQKRKKKEIEDLKENGNQQINKIAVYTLVQEYIYHSLKTGVFWKIFGTPYITTDNSVKFFTKKKKIT